MAKSVTMSSGLPFASHLVLACALTLAACADRDAPARPPTSTTAPAPRGKDPAAARALIANGAVVLDVRTPDEFANDHLPRAVNIPLADVATRLADVDALVGHDRSRPVVVYCAAGSRAAKAKAQLDTAGFTHVVNGGGLDDLR